MRGPFEDAQLSIIFVVIAQARKECKRKSAKERKRAQKDAKERFRVKIVSDQV